MTSTNRVNNQKKIRHGGWSFDFNQRSNRYLVDVESCENHEFNQVTEDHKICETTKTGLTETDLEDFRRASLIHKIARKRALTFLYAGGKLADLVDSVENIILKMCNQDPKTYYNNLQTSGLAFPVGVNINNVVAHDSKYMIIGGKKDQREFFAGDVVKVDIGVHINGRIIDSAFTHIITEKPGIHDTESIYNSVLDASKDSMFNAIKLAGPDQRLDEMSEVISEIIESYEVNMGDTVTLPIRPVTGIGGHNIQQYRIHGGKLILSRPDYAIQGDQRMEEDEIYAIETYATTGAGIMTQNDQNNLCTHYMQKYPEEITKATKKEKKQYEKMELYDWIKTRNGLPFSSAWIDTTKIHKIDKALKMGITSDQLNAYPPLYDESNSVVAQFEHTVHIGSNSVEIFSLGEDF
jgi:methionyl aminopeptidase